MLRHLHSFALLLLASVLGLASTAVAKEDRKRIDLAEDGQRILTIKGDVKTLAFGDVSIADGASISATEILVRGLSAGETPLLVLLQDGSRQRYQIRVLRNPGGHGPGMELRLLLGEMPGVIIRVDGDGILNLEGRPKTKEDADRLKRVVSLFPAVRNRTAPFAATPGETKEECPPSPSEGSSGAYEVPRGIEKLVTIEGTLKAVTFKNPRIATGRRISASEFLIVAVKEGETTVVVTMEGGERNTHVVRVQKDEAEKTVREIRAMTGEMENVIVRALNGRAYVEGYPLTDEDATRLRKALKLHPEARDLTLRNGCRGEWPKRGK